MRAHEDWLIENQNQEPVFVFWLHHHEAPEAKPSWVRTVITDSKAVAEWSPVISKTEAQGSGVIGSRWRSRKMCADSLLREHQNHN